MASMATSSTKRSIRSHRKSRNGCGTCKRRKVKCDEAKPCSNCKTFGVPCDLVPEDSHREHDTSTPVARRGRGRPRKIWHSSATVSSPSTDTSTPAPPPTTPDTDLAPINLVQAELLLHFITTTAQTLAGEGQIMQDFWKRNVPTIGLTHPFVLNLIFSCAAFHLDHQPPSPPRRSRSAYLSLAQKHFTAGLSGFSAQLSHPGPENCGALYLGAVMTCYCTFAAGPANPDDLLVCTADKDGDSVSWMPFVHGVRLMHQTFTPDVLFTGLMEPFRTSSSGEVLERPVYVRDGFARLEWEEALDGLRAFVRPGAVYLKALDSLIGIYAATYGRRGPDGRISYHGPSENQFIFGWLYRIEREFVACVKNREVCALLVLAHYAVLLNEEAIRTGWYVEGWRQHIIARVGEMLVEEECREYMRWPMEQVVVRETADGSGAQ